LQVLQSLKKHGPLGVVVLIYLFLATAHSLIAPLTVGNDEWAHFLYLRFIADHGHLPTDIAQRDEAGYKSDAPPLYHLLSAGLGTGVEPVRLLRPLDAPRRYLADNIVNSHALVHTAVEQWPYRGEVLLWYLGRGLSIIFGAALIGVTYITSLALFPSRQGRALLAAAFVAFTPAVLFHSSVLSYESLSALATALFLLAAIHAIKQPQRPGRWLLLGAMAGLAITTKYSAVLLPVEICFIAWLAGRGKGAKTQENRDANEQGRTRANNSTFDIRHSTFAIDHSLRFFLTRLSLAAAAMILVSSWWFGFVAWHFNTVDSQGLFAGVVQPLLVGDASDTTSVKVASFLFGEEAVAATVRSPKARNSPQLFQQFVDSFWAAPVAGKFALSPWLPLAFTLLAAVGGASLWPIWRQSDYQKQQWLLLLLVHSLLILPLLAVRVVFSFDPREVAQGRHVLLPAVSAIAVLLIWGWNYWSPKLSLFAVGGLFLWTLLGQLGWAIVTYPPPIPVWPNPPETELATLPQSVTFDDTLRLTHASWQNNGNQLTVTLGWESLATAPEDYLVELSLLDSTGKQVSYGVSHPVQGRYPTRAWEPGDFIKDRHSLPLVEPLAGNYQLALRFLTRQGQPWPHADVTVLGTVRLNSPAVTENDPCTIWSSFPTLLGKRPLRPNASFTVMAAQTPKLRLKSHASAASEQQPFQSVANFHIFVVEHDWPSAGQLWVAGQECGQLEFDIPPRNFTRPDIPHLLPANFNNQIELLGYDLPTRRIQAGERLPLTLYWRALSYMGQDYRLFANPLDANQQRWGGYDRRPRDGYSTLRWTPGEVITDPFGIPISPNAPPGIYTIDFGFYRESKDGADYLPLVHEDQPTEQRSIRLGPIKVGGPPPQVVTTNPNPQVSLEQTLGQQITLLGYTLTNSAGQPISSNQSPISNLQSLALTLYWQADTRPAADYTTFFHLRNGSNQTVAQKDAPPAGGGYPTSLWNTGEVIVDELVLPLENIPPGQYTPVVGLYNPVTGYRLATPANPANEITLESINIP